jgi:hypothetical protein
MFSEDQLKLFDGLELRSITKGVLLWARRAFERSLPNLRVRRMKFLFAASKENSKAKRGFDS